MNANGIHKGCIVQTRTHFTLQTHEHKKKLSIIQSHNTTHPNLSRTRKHPSHRKQTKRSTTAVIRWIGRVALGQVNTVFLQKSRMKAAELDRKIENAAKKGYKATKQLYKKIIRRIRGNDVRYFNTTKRGDINDWRKQLHGLNKKEVGRTMKCVIAAMTIGTDVSSLFPDVISCIHNETLELKKLVYL